MVRLLPGSGQVSDSSPRVGVEEGELVRLKDGAFVGDLVAGVGLVGVTFVGDCVVGFGVGLKVGFCVVGLELGAFEVGVAVVGLGDGFNDGFREVGLAVVFWRKRLVSIVERCACSSRRNSTPSLLTLIFFFSRPPSSLSENDTDAS